MEGLRCPAEQHRERYAGFELLLLEHRQLGFDRFELCLLLRQVQMRGGACLNFELDGVEDAVDPRARSVFASSQVRPADS